MKVYYFEEMLDIIIQFKLDNLFFLIFFKIDGSILIRMFIVLYIRNMFCRKVEEYGNLLFISYLIYIFWEYDVQCFFFIFVEKFIKGIYLFFFFII